MKDSNYAVGSAIHVNDFLSVPNAKVIIDSQENSCRIEELLSLVGRISSTSPGKKVKYWLCLE